VSNNSMYHLVALLVKVPKKILNHILSSTKEFEEQHRWYVMTCMEGSLPCFSSNFGISYGFFLEIYIHKGWCLMVSLFNYKISIRSNVSRKGNGVFENGFELKENIACNFDGP
jgi:hypothetical protein